MASSQDDPKPPQRGSDEAALLALNAHAADEPEGLNLLALMAKAEEISKRYQSQTLDRPLSRSYRAWQNQHAEGSKYLGPNWKGRSRLFVPKTRMSVRKNLAAAAAALFATDNVVNISAVFEDDDYQRAVAATMKAVVDHRLSNGAGLKSGLPWFMIAMGGCLDSQLTGIVCSKQFWEYEEAPTGETEMAMVPALDEAGEPLLDEYGEPVLMEGEVDRMAVVRDRPMVELIPVENIGVDPAVPWYDPVQLGRWFYVDYPMGLSDVKAMMARGGRNDAWLEVEDAVLLKGTEPDNRKGSRRVREGGGDRFQDAKTPGDLDVVWVRENFIRIDGIDYHFWSVGRHAYLSKVRRAREAYPEFDGERCYKIGFAQIDSHRVFPMAPVESWQPLQNELNDVTNLRQDTLKRAIAPLTLVRRGKNVDIAALQRRGQPEVIVQVDDLEKDVKFEMTPGPTGASYTESATINANFDELSGSFSTSSVQSNRQLNETVGGMRLMSGAANSVSEFDLRVWSETWIEPVLRQITHLVRYHESDERILAIAGAKARVLSEFGYMPTFSDFEQVEVILRVNVGIGASDPMQKLQKLDAAMKMLAPLFQEMKAQGIKPRLDAFIEEIFGQAGFKDGRRFFEFGEPDEGGPPPELLQFMEEMKLEREKLALEARKMMVETQADLQQNQADNATKLRIEHMKGERETAKQMFGMAQERQRQRHDIARERVGRISEILAGRGQGQGGERPSASPAAQQPSAPSMPALLPVPMPQQQPDQVQAQMLERMDQTAHLLASVAGILADISAKQSAPTEVVYGPNGKAVGIRKHGEFNAIVRNQDGQMAAAVPITPQTI